MMTQEEVAQVIAYCEENKVSYKQRLDELGIAAWMFYDAKRKYAPKQEADNAGNFLQLVPGGTFFPSAIKPARSRGRRQKDAEQEAAPVNIELKTATGTMLPSYTPSWTVARLWASTRGSGWRTCCFASPATKTTVPPSANSCPSNGQSNPSRNQINKSSLIGSLQLVDNRRQ